MVESLSSSKIKAVSSDSDDAEAVACMAAAAAYLQLEAEEQAAASTGPSKKGQLSEWGRASLQEGTQSVTAPEYSGSRRLPLWRNFLGAFSLAIGTMLTMGSAQADDTMGGVMGNQTGDEPVYTAQATSFAVSGSPYSRPAQQRQFRPGYKIPIKVALAINVGEISLDSVDGAQIIDVSTGKQIAGLQPLSQWRFAARTANGVPAIAVSGRREVDKYLIATGDQLKTEERNVAFFPSQYIGPPAIKGFQLAQQAEGAVAKKPAWTPALTISCPATPQQCAQANLVSNFKNSKTPLDSADGTAPPSEDEELDEGADYTLGSASADVLPHPQLDLFGGITSGVIITADQNNTDNSQYVFTLNGRMYRGALWLRPSVVKDKNGASVTRVTAINVLDLEDYLMSVIPSEMPASWPREALKAQAIAARSYAIANLGKYGSQGFDVKSTVLDQAYRGASAETIATNRAIAETRGIVMKHQGKVVPGFFHSTSAGHTDVAEHVWTKEVPYLKSVPDVDHKSKYVLWERRFLLNQVDAALGKDTGGVLALFPTHRSPSGRVKNLLVVGATSTTVVPGSAIRQMFALPSTNFNVLAYQDCYVFKGQGFGHGLGMSQYGARTLADHGYNAAQILTYYYKDVTFEHIVETPAL